MINLYRERHDCRLCGSDNIETVVPLEPMPMATPTFKVTEASMDDSIYREWVPLGLDLCLDCGNLQVSSVVNPEVLYSNYVYRTSGSLGLSEHFSQYAKETLDIVSPKKGSLIVEIGSNDGTLLRFFKQKEMNILGVDPAVSIANKATEDGAPTMASFFSAKVASKIISEKGNATIIIANNVFANIDDLTDIMDGVKALLSQDGVFIVETQYGPDVIENNLLDTVYHEHLSYFALSPLKNYYSKFGLEIIDVQRVSTKGGSFRIIAQHTGGNRPISDNVKAIIESENLKDIFSPNFYSKFRDEILFIKSDLLEIVDDAKKNGKKIAGYGVSVGTTTLLSQFGLTKKVDYLIDDDPNKDKMLSGPGYDIPLIASDKLAEEMPGIVIIFAWRYAEPIISKNKKYIENGGKFVIPLPSLRII